MRYHSERAFSVFGTNFELNLTSQTFVSEAQRRIRLVEYGPSCDMHIRRPTVLYKQVR